MTIWQSFIEALESLSGNKLRSGLTVLGIVIGVAAVIAMLAVGQGAEASITGSISGIGTNLLFVFRGDADNSIRNPKPLTLGDADALRDQFAAPSIEAVAPALQGDGIVSFGGEQTSPQIFGVTPEYFQVRNLNLAEGEAITEEHMLGRASVVILGPEAAEALFGHADGITGETVRIEGQPFRVIGVLESKGGGAFGSEDNQVLVPFTTAQARLIRRSTSNRVDIIFVQAVSGDVVTQATEEIAQILRTRHRTPVGEDDFTIFSQQDLLSTFQSITGILTIFLGGIAGISLLVGGIGIMNIMLVSVTERTREIGLRKALGARKRDILTQFLVEAAVLGLAGGIAGVIIGTAGSIALSNAINQPIVVSPSATALALGVSIGIGLVFGVYPASRAARLAPIDALRSE